jgi:hypothetical protein
MIAGGVGTIDAELTHKILFPAGTPPDPARRPGQYRHGGSAARWRRANAASRL